MQHRFSKKFSRSRSFPLVLAAISGAIVSFSPVAGASPNYPTVVQEQLGMACLPRCTICHTTEPGILGTATQPFARTLVEHGLQPAAEETLVTALTGFPADVDSDDDGVPDLVELQGGGMSDEDSDPPAGAAGAGATTTSADQPRHPNEPGVGDVCADVPRYGCGAHMAPRPSFPRGVPWAWALLTLGLVAITWKVRRRVVGRQQQ